MSEKNVEVFKLIGGARIGIMNMTWPLAKLTATKERLNLSTLLGHYVFSRDDIISIESCGTIPFIGKGIKINHRIHEYNDRVIFWTFKDPALVIDEIKKIGFLKS